MARRGDGYRWAAAAVAAAALGLRVGYALLTPAYVPAHDDARYDALALAIARTGSYPYVNGHPTAYRPPGFTYLLGALYAVTGPGHARIWAGRMLEAVIGTALVVVVGAVARRMFGPAAGLATMGLTAVFVPLIAVGGALLSEPLAALLALAAVLAVLRWRDDRRDRWAVAAGLAVGATALTRSNGAVLVLAAVVGMWVRPRRSGNEGGEPAGRLSSGPTSAAATRLGRIRPVALVLGVAALTVAPWTVRNAVVMHSWIPVSDEAGGTLAGTYNPVSAADRLEPAYWHLLADIPPYWDATAALRGGPEPAFQSRLLHLALSYAARHPAYVAEVGYWDGRRLFDLTGATEWRYGARLAGIDSPWVADACAWSIWVLLALVAAAVLVGRVRRRVPAFYWLTTAALLLSVALVNGESPRLRAPLDPFLLVLAGGAAAALARAATRTEGLRA